MKLLRFEKTPSPIQWRQVYERTPGLSDRPYTQQLDALCDDMSQYAGAMRRAMGPMGYDVTEVYTDVEPLQRRWAREHSIPWTAKWKQVIPLAQARAVRPTIIWSYDSRNLDFNVLAEMRRTVPTIELITGFIGSSSFDIATFKQYDFLLTCTDEYVATFRTAGIETYKASHVFDAAVLEHLDPHTPKTVEVGFSGGVCRQQDAHLEREQVLERMISVPGVELFCPTADRSRTRDFAETTARRGVYLTQQLLAAAGIPSMRRRTIPLIGKAATWKNMPMRQINPRLYPFMRPPRYGMEMYKLLRATKVVIDCVATAEAANMRLFEATGVGSCLLTSWRPNLNSVFELDREIVAYKCPDECAEKACWLLDHPDERERIAAAGQARTLRDYTYEHRAALLDQLIRKHLAKKRESAQSTSSR
jgi:spore maturation protein CgeB